MRQASIHNCISCNKELTSQQTRQGKKYCCIGCYRVAQRSGKYKKGSSIKNRCDNCEVVFYGWHASSGKTRSEGKNTFCSRSCYDEHRSKIKQDRDSRKCDGCGKMYVSYRSVNFKNTYCSNECRVISRKAKPRGCGFCGTLFTPVTFPPRGGVVTPSNRKYCCNKCTRSSYSVNKDRSEKISKAFSGEKHPNWLGGSHRGDKRGHGWEKIAERCRELHGRKCNKCGMSEGDSIGKGWGRLQVNHITPFHQHQNKTQANKQSNLEALCKSCHTIVDAQWRRENQVQMILDIFR